MFADTVATNVDEEISDSIPFLEIPLLLDGAYAETTEPVEEKSSPDADSIVNVVASVPDVIQSAVLSKIICVGVPGVTSIDENTSNIIRNKMKAYEGTLYPEITATSATGKQFENKTRSKNLDEKDGKLEKKITFTACKH